jgi:hypothetical protein
VRIFITLYMHSMMNIVAGRIQNGFKPDYPRRKVD